MATQNCTGNKRMAPHARPHWIESLALAAALVSFAGCVNPVQPYRPTVPSMQPRSGLVPGAACSDVMGNCAGYQQTRWRSFATNCDQSNERIISEREIGAGATGSATGRPTTDAPELLPPVKPNGPDEAFPVLPGLPGRNDGPIDLGPPVSGPIDLLTPPSKPVQPTQPTTPDPAAEKKPDDKLPVDPFPKSNEAPDFDEPAFPLPLDIPSGKPTKPAPGNDPVDEAPKPLPGIDPGDTPPGITPPPEDAPPLFPMRIRAMPSVEETASRAADGNQVSFGEILPATSTSGSALRVQATASDE